MSVTQTLSDRRRIHRVSARTGSSFGSFLGISQVPLEIDNGRGLPCFVLLHTSNQLFCRLDLAISVFDLGLDSEQAGFLLDKRGNQC